MVPESDLQARARGYIGSCIEADVVFFSGSPFSGWRFVGKMWLAVDISGIQGARSQGLILFCLGPS